MLKMKSNFKLLKIIVLNSVEEILFQIDKTVGLTREWIESRVYSPGVGNLCSTGHYAANNSTPKHAAGSGLHSPPPINALTPQDYHPYRPYNCALFQGSLLLPQCLCHKGISFHCKTVWLLQAHILTYKPPFPLPHHKIYKDFPWQKKLSNSGTSFY